MFPEERINTSSQTDEEEKETEVQSVDLDAEIEVKDPEADVDVVPRPPDAGDYIFKLSFADKRIEGKNSKKSGNYAVAHLVNTIVKDGDEFDGYDVYNHITSAPYRGSSGVHSLMAKLGEPLPQKDKLKNLMAQVEKVINSSPVIKGELEWQAKEKDPGSKNADTNGYVTLATRMAQFPKNPDGSRSNFIASKKDGSPVPATAYIVGYKK